MKVLLLVFATAAMTSAAVPRPTGRIILLPAPTEATSATLAPRRESAQTQNAQPQESQAARVLDSGEYYVLTPEGKLQMVKYSTAVLRNPSGQPAQVAQQPEPFAQFQVQYFQYPGFEVSPPQAAAPILTKADHKKKPKDASEFEAKVQFRDVKPISAPIYAHNPTPLVQILKK